MQGYCGAAAIALLLAMVVCRTLMLKRLGIQTIHFGKIDKKDFLIPPFALFYFYLVFAAALGWPLASSWRFFASSAAGWVGVAFCVAGLLLLFLSLVSFGRSFRVGIDAERPDKLVTTGIFRFSRNPIYVAFALVLLGEFLIFPNWVLLVYLIAAVWLFQRQVLREEEYLKDHYGAEYSAYASRVRRYL